MRFSNLWAWMHRSLSDKGQAQQELLTSFYKDRPFYTSGLITKYGFISFGHNRVMDVRYTYLEKQQKIIQLKEEDFLNEVWMENALKHARKIMIERAFMHREKHHLGAKYHLKTGKRKPEHISVSPQETVGSHSMFEALQTPPTPRRNTNTH